ncbi:ABC transporter permease [Pseudactinotalea sp.]|uniref:ABC transporter permease n=1 Tax=Pseudactinotalea sp. TaxID=1926260 RepID=UPI003B3B29F0
MIDLSPFDIALFAAAIRLAAPLLLAALGELVSERAGVINIGLDGMMLGGAFTGFLGVHASGSPVVGLLTGIAGGLLIGAIMALFAVSLGGDQIVVGVAINLLVGGATLFLFRLLFSGQPQTERMSVWSVPFLSDIPVIGPILFTQLPIVYVALLLVPSVALLLTRTRLGLRIRATGELPVAVTAAGGNPQRTQWLAVLTCAALAGLGGAFLSVVQLGLFRENMTAGRGFLALAAVVFGRWRPVGVLLACLVFGFTDALQLRLQSVATLPWALWAVIAVAGIGLIALGLRRLRAGEGPGRPTIAHVAVMAAGVAVVLVGVTLAVVTPTIKAPAQLWLSMPYVMSLVVLAVAGRTTRAPSMIGRPVGSATQV